MGPIPVWELFERTAVRFPERPCLRAGIKEEGPSYSYGEAWGLARDLSRGLIRRGIAKGDRVAIFSPVSPPWAVACLAALRAGTALVPVDTASGSDQLCSVLKDTSCRAVFATPGNTERLKKAVERLEVKPLVITLHEPGTGEECLSLEQLRAEGERAEALEPSLSPGDIGAIIYTSGTTAQPKGAVISHRSINSSVAGLTAKLPLVPGESVLVALPSHHVFALLGGLLCPLALGISVVYLPSPDSARLSEAMTEEGITAFPCVPEVLYRLHRRIVGDLPGARGLLFRALLDLSWLARRTTGTNFGWLLFRGIHQRLGRKLRLLISGGAPLDADVMRDFLALGFDLLQTYGLTETFGGGAISSFGHEIPGSVGRPIPGAELRIAEPDSDGVGEVLIGGAVLMEGYLGDSEATREVLRDGWLHTGDLGRVDSRGNTYIVGREKEIIVLSSGKKISPEPLERHYLQSRCIREICVMGLRDPSGATRSVRLHALVVPDFEHLKSLGQANVREVIRSEIADLSARLPPYQRIVSYDILTLPLPVTATRKLQRQRLQKEVEAGRFQRAVAPGDHEGPEDEPIPSSPQWKRLVALLQLEAPEGARIRPKMNLELDLGFDSLQRVELMASIERAFGVHPGEPAFSRIQTVRDLMEAISGEAEPRDHETLPPPVTFKEILGGVGPEEFSGHSAGSETMLLASLRGMFLWAARLLFKLLFRLKVEGRENLAGEGPYIICANHQSYLDGVLLASALPPFVVRRLFSLGWTPWFDRGLKKVLGRLANVVPIDPDTNLLQAMKVSAAGLKQGRILLVFPEGGLSRDGRLQPFKKGAAILACELSLDVVPVSIDGSLRAWPKDARFLRPARIRIRIGRPFRPGEAYRGEEAYGLAARRMQEEVRQLLDARAS